MKNIFWPPFWKKLRKLPKNLRPYELPQTSATVAVAVVLKSSATAVELRSSVKSVTALTWLKNADSAVPHAGVCISRYMDWQCS